MAGFPVAFQPNAFQNNAFQTGIGWVYDADVPANRARRAYQAVNLDVIPSPIALITAAIGWVPELSRPYRSPLPQAGLVEVEPAPRSGRVGYEAEIPRPFRVSWLQAGSVEVEPFIVSGRSGYEAELPRLFRAPWLQAGSVEVEPFIVSGHSGYEAELPRLFRASWLQAGSVEVEPFIVSGRSGYEAELPRPFRAPWLQAGLFETWSTVVTIVRDGYEAELPRLFRIPWSRAGLVEVESYLVSGRGGFEAILPRLYRAPLPQASLVEVQPFTISGRGGYEAELPRLFRAPWLQAGLVEVEPCVVSGRGGYEAEMPRPFRAPWPQASLVEVRPVVISGRAGFEAEIPRSFRAAPPQAGLVEVDPTINAGFFGWENQLVLPRRLQSAVVHIEEWIEAIIVEGDWGFEAVLPRPYRGPLPQAGLVEVQPFSISGRGGYDTELPRPFRAPWPQAGLVEVAPKVISGRGGYEATMPSLFRAAWPQASLVEVEPALKISGSYGWDASSSLLQFKSHLPILVDSPFHDTAIHYGFDAELPRAYRAAYAQAKIDDWVPMLVCPTVSALQAYGSLTRTNVTTTILPFSTPAPAFILLGIVTKRLSGTSPILVTFVGGDASGLTWKKLAGGPIGVTDFTVEYWGAFASNAIPFDSVDVITNDRGDTSVAFIALAGVNAMPAGSVIGPTTVANNLHVVFPSTSPRSMLFAAGVSSLGSSDSLTPGLNTTIYEQPDAAQFVRSTNPTLGGMLTLSTSGYEDPTTIYYLGIEILAIPCYLSGLYGWDSVIAQKAPAGHRPLEILDVELAVSTPVVFAGFEQALPPSWRSVPTQAGLVAVWPPILVGPNGWDQFLPLPHRAVFAPPAPFETWPEAIIVEGVWGFEQALPPLWKPVLPQAGRVAVWPSVLVGSSGWDQSLPLPHRAAFAPPAPFEAWPEAIIVEGVWGFEQALPSLWKPVPKQAGLVEVWPADLSGRYGWEQSLPAPFRASFIPHSMFEAWPEALVVEGTWGFDESLPLPWRAAPLRAGLVDVWPAAFTSTYGFEQSLPGPFRASFVPPAPAEAWPASTANEGVFGFDSTASKLFKYVYTSPQTSDPTPSTFAAWGWELSLSAPTRTPSADFRLIEVFPTLIKPWPTDLLDMNRLWQAVRRDVSVDTLAALFSESLDGWENLSPTPRQIARRAFLDEVFPSTVEVAPWEQDLPSQLVARFKFAQPTLIDVFPSSPSTSLFPWDTDISTLQAKAGRQIITFDDWWAPIVQPNPLLPGGGYKPASIFERRNEDRDFINRVEQTIEAIDGELLSLREESQRDEPEDDSTADYKVAEPDVLPPGWYSGKDKPKRPEREQVRHVHYNFAADLDFGVRRRIVGILDRAEHRNVDIFGSDAFLTSETARINGQLVVQGTNAWILKVAGEARLELAKEALAEGFKLVSFDDTSLSFIHRPTYPWKQLYLGAGLGATLMGAGVGLGYLIWGRSSIQRSPTNQIVTLQPKKIVTPKPKKVITSSKPAKQIKEPSKPATPSKPAKPAKK
jgi:hypothetical protein